MEAGLPLLTSSLVQAVPVVLLLRPTDGLDKETLVPSTRTPMVPPVVAMVEATVETMVAALPVDQETDNGETANTLPAPQMRNSSESCSARPTTLPRLIPASTSPTTTTSQSRLAATMSQNQSTLSPILLWMTTSLATSSLPGTLLPRLYRNTRSQSLWEDVTSWLVPRLALARPVASCSPFCLRLSRVDLLPPLRVEEASANARLSRRP